MAPPAPLGYLLKQAQQALRSAMDEALRAHQLTLSQVAVLAGIRRSPGQSNAELARAGFMTPQSMADVLASLEAAGLVVRHPHPNGGRALQAELTPEGAERLRACHAAMAEVEARLLTALSPSEQRQFRDLLERCVASLRAAAPAPAAQRD